MIRTASCGMTRSLAFFVLYVFAAAFRSVAHACMFAVAGAVQPWTDFAVGIENLHSGSKAGGYSGGFGIFLFDPF